jgi:periplasmic protein TonB
LHVAVSAEQGRLLLARARLRVGLDLPVVDPSRSVAVLAVVVTHALALMGLLAHQVRPRFLPVENAVETQLVASRAPPSQSDPLPPREIDWRPVLPDLPMPRLAVEEATTAITLPASRPPVVEDPVERAASIDGAAPPLLDAQAVGYLIAPAPRYPQASRRLREEGEVLVRVLIGTDGRPAEVSLLRSSGFTRLDDAALAAVRVAMFRPYVVAGQARSAYVRVPVEFSLGSKERSDLFSRIDSG